MLRNKTTYFLLFFVFEMDENTKKITWITAARTENRKTRRNIGKVPKNACLNCVKSNKLVYMFN